MDIDGAFVLSNTVELNFQESGIQVYPNPVTDLLSIRLQYEKRTVIKIVDLRGIILFETVGNEHELITFDTQEFPQGIYVIISTPEGGKSVPKRFIKQ